MAVGFGSLIILANTHIKGHVLICSLQMADVKPPSITFARQFRTTRNSQAKEMKSTENTVKTQMCVTCFFRESLNPRIQPLNSQLL